MQQKLILLIGILILGGCSKSFEIEKSTCDEVHRNLASMELSGVENYSYSSRGELYKWRREAEDCRKQTSLSQRDYEKYMKLLNQIQSLDKEADELIEEGKIIHSQRIEKYD